MSEHEPQRIPHETVSVGDVLVPLPWDFTEIFVYTDTDFTAVGHIYTVHPDNPEHRVILFGADESVLYSLADMGYRVVTEERPTDEDLEHWVQWQAQGLDEELEELNG